MKTKFWILLLGVLLALSVGLSFWVFRSGGQASAVRIRSEGKILYTLPLQADREIRVETSRGTNVVTIRDGRVAVTQATCPDGHCMARGFCSGGAQIVCLPNRLVIEFIGSRTLDGVTG